MRRSIRKHVWKTLLGLLFVAMVIVGLKSVALADVNIGDVIDSSNYQKIKGMVPDAVYEYVQKGWITMKIGKLNYEPGDILSKEYKESLTKNIGKYIINDKGELLEKASGKVDPYDMIGVPFPVLDLKDPNVGLQMLQNHVYGLSMRGDMISTATLFFVGKKMERYISGPQQMICLTNTAKNIAKQAAAANFGKQLETSFTMKVTDPFELNGLATMTYTYRSNQADKVFAYVPALRRTRTLTSAARSDAMFGTDYALDDASGGFMGKTRDFTCKYLRTQDTLQRLAGPNVIELVRKPDGTGELKKNYENVKWGFQTPGWKGKPWAVTNGIWAKRSVHVIECRARDPYYNYGKFELWYDPKSYNFAYKIIWDRAGKRWKVMNTGLGAYMATDGTIGKLDAAFGDWIYDEQRDHATCIDEFNTKEKKIFDAKLNVDDFTLGGFTKFSK